MSNVIMVGFPGKITGLKITLGIISGICSVSGLSSCAIPVQ